MIYIIALFTFQGILGFAIITGMLIFMIKISKVPFSYIVKGLKAIVVLLLIYGQCLIWSLHRPVRSTGTGDRFI